jgi:hypothetical protein
LARNGCEIETYVCGLNNQTLNKRVQSFTEDKRNGYSITMMGHGEKSLLFIDFVDF